MKCTKCGKEVKKADKFCQYCGTEIKEETKTTAAAKKTTAKKAEKVEEVKVEKVTKTEEPQARRKGLGIAGMVLGILSIVFCWCGLWVIIFPILGLIFSLISKKNAFKIVGIITSIVGFILEVIITIITLAAMTSFFGIISDYVDDYDDDDYNYTYKYASPYGEWTCTSYPEYSYTSKEETTLKFNYTGTFIYGPKDDLDKNYYSGKFTYEKEYEKNKLYNDKEFIDIKAPVDKFVLGGIEQDATNKNLNMEMEFINDYKEAIIMFYNTYNTYHCTKK
jgi:hypothetical protein